jgi:nitrogen-specific signal transduction histidine kinase
VLNRSQALDRLLVTAIAANKETDRLMNLVDKMAVLRERAESFNRETDKELDAIAEKIETARKKREETAARHHAYYDGVIKGIDESIAVIDQLSNGPVDGTSGT